MRNLFAMVTACDVLVEKKIELTRHVGKKYGVTEADVNAASSKNGVPFYKPKLEIERFEQLFEVFILMMLGTPRNAKEIKVIKDLAIKFDFSPSIIDDLGDFINDRVIALMSQDREIKKAMEEYVEFVKERHGIKNR